MQDRASRPSAVPIVAIAFLSWLAGILAASRSDGMAADALRYVVPGLSLAWASRRLPADSPMARIGGWLLLISAFAFAMQGLFAFDAGDPDAFSSRMRALAWTLWWIAFAPGALLQALSRGNRFVAASVAAVALVCAAALLPIPRVAMPCAPVVATLAWFAWWFAALRPALSRGAA